MANTTPLNPKRIELFLASDAFQHGSRSFRLLYMIFDESVHEVSSEIFSNLMMSPYDTLQRTLDFELFVTERVALLEKTAINALGGRRMRRKARTYGKRDWGISPTAPSLAPEEIGFVTLLSC
jgi:hypothetical protein